MSRTNLYLFMLIISLILNFLILGKVNELQNETHILQSNMNNIDSSVQNLKYSFNSSMEEIEKEQRWISPLKQDVEQLSGQEMNIKLSWQVKDYLEGASVFFYYRLPNEQEYTKLEAIPTGGGGFLVEIPIKISTGPMWNLSISSNINNNSMAVSQESGSSYEPYNLGYYISVKEGERIRTSEEASVNLNTFKYDIYAPLDINVAILEDNQYDVHLSELIKEEPKVKIKRAVLEIYHEDALVAQKELEKQDTEYGYDNVYNAIWSPKEETFDSVMIIVEYDNGEVFKRDITGNEY